MINQFWPAEDDQRLRELWAEGHSGSVIGKKMNRSKNAIIGRAHRLKLPPRVSPIQNERWTAALIDQLKSLVASGLSNKAIGLVMSMSDNTVGKKRKEMNLARPVKAAVVKVVKPVAPKPVRRVILPPPAKPVVQQVAKPEITGRTYRPGSDCACKWPLNHGRPRWIFCTEIAVLGKPYCTEHERRAHPVEAAA